MLYQCEVIFFIYVNDGIFTSPIDSEIDQAIKDIGTKVEIEDQGTLNNYIGVNI